MKEITSFSNEWLKNVAKLKDKKGSKEQGKCLVETYKVVKECIEKQLVTEVIMTKSQYKKHGQLYQQQTIIEDTLATKLSTTTTTDGIFAIVTIPTHHKVKSNNILVLDHMQDPSNLGAMIRTALACDYKTIYLYNCTYPFSPKVIRSSMGYVFDIHFVNATYDDIVCLKNEGYSCLCADMNGENVFQIKEHPARHILVIGNEGHGVSKELLSLVDKTLSIPMENHVESLNASVSAGIMMYQLKEK